VSDSRSRPVGQPASGKKKAVGGPDASGSTTFLFVASIIAVAVAVVFLVFVAADAMGGDDPPSEPAAPDATQTAASEDGTAPADKTPGGETATSQPGAQPSAAPTSPTTDATGDIILPCGDILVPLDKQHRLERSCVPAGLQSLPGEYASGTQRMISEAGSAAVEMFAAAGKDGYALYANSSYRSFDEQAATYQYWVNLYGVEYANRTSAQPGHSEHQLGTTADVGWNGCELECTVGTPEAEWIADNSYKYGFIVSYPEGKEHITGYAPEPWHVRFVGKAKAQEVRNSGLTLHEFLLQ